MELVIYSIKDTKMAFKQPFYQHNDELAIRLLKNAVNDKNGNDISMNAEDMELWKIGIFDDVTGMITETKPTFIIKASDLIKKE